MPQPDPVDVFLPFAVLLESRRFALIQSVTAVERGVLRFRVRVIDKVRRGDLRFLEQQAGVEAYAPLTQEIGLISEFSHR